MNELALFAGVGGGLLGTHLVGIRTVCAVERNEHRISVLVERQNQGMLRRFPVWDDVRTFDGSRWRGTVDFVSGGFPCQAFSSAARGRNNADNLWPDYRRVVSEVEPTYVFAENVTAKAVEAAAHDLANMGYKTELLSLSAADLGADHVRERFWLLAYADDKSELQRTVNAKMAGMSGICPNIWEAKPAESGVVDGVSRRVDRYEACGNGQVPIVACTALWTLANA